MTLEQYKTIINAYLDFYPDDKVDVQVNNTTLKQALDDDANGKEISQETLDSINDDTFGALDIITYYPSLTLTNDSGKQYTVYDIYVQASFPELNIAMGRTTYNSEEVRIGYRHSHIPQGHFSSLSDFCTGDSYTPINRMKDKARRGDYGNFETFIQSFIIEVERMIRIESNAGGPYINFSRVGKNSESKPLRVRLSYDVYYPNQKTKDLLKKFIDYYCSLYLDRFYYDGRNWQLAATDAEFIKRVTKVAKTWKKTENANIYKKVNIIHGLYYNPTGKDYYHIYAGDTADWTFKGKHSQLKVISKTEDNIKSDTIIDIEYISLLYSFLLNLINGVYATDKYKDCFHARAYKIKTALIKAM